MPPWNLRTSRSALAAAAAFLAGAAPALASPGCDGVNSNFINASVSGGGASYTSLVSNFAVGDVVTLTVNRAVAGAGTFRFFDGSGNNIYVDVAKAASTVVSYVVRGATDTTLNAMIISSGPTISISAVCRGGGLVGSTAARAIQLNLTPVVALTSGAAITSAIDGAIADTFAGGGAMATGGPGYMRVNLLPEGSGRVPEAFGALGYVDRGGRLPAPAERPWSAWIDGRGTRWSEDATAAQVRSTQINVTAGFGYKPVRDAVIGLFVGYENFDYDVPTFSGGLNGNGWTTGVYAGLRFGSGLRLDGALAWSNVHYNVSAVTAPNAINGSASGSFEGGRALGSVGLTGTYLSSGFIFEPSLRVFALWEQQKSWTDNSGQEQAARTFSVGRASAGAKLAYPLPGTRDLLVTPYAGAYGDYRFSNDDALLPVAVGTFGMTDGLSGRVVSGVALTGRSGGTLTVGGELGALGQTGQRLWIVNARGVMPF